MLLLIQKRRWLILKRFLLLTFLIIHQFFLTTLLTDRTKVPWGVYILAVSYFLIRILLIVELLMRLGVAVGTIGYS